MSKIITLPSSKILRTDGSDPVSIGVARLEVSDYAFSTIKSVVKATGFQCISLTRHSSGGFVFSRFPAYKSIGGLIDLSFSGIADAYVRNVYILCSEDDGPTLAMAVIHNERSRVDLEYSLQGIPSLLYSDVPGIRFRITQ